MSTKQPSPFAVPFDLAECRRRCLVSMLNTPVGHWLAAACNEVERLREEVERLKLQHWLNENGLEIVADVAEVVAAWQRSGRSDTWRPVIRGELLELIERYIEKRKKQ